jgi:hypothetical protein
MMKKKAHKFPNKPQVNWQGLCRMPMSHQRVSLSMRATPCCQGGITKPKACCNFCVLRREFKGRCAGVGKDVVGTGAISLTFKASSGRMQRACATTWLA